MGGGDGGLGCAGWMLHTPQYEAVTHELEVRM